jgi:hypothetical protein
MENLASLCGAHQRQVELEYWKLMANTDTKPDPIPQAFARSFRITERRFSR